MRKRINNDFDALVEVLHEGVKIDLSLYEITGVRMVSNQAYQVTGYEVRNGSLFLHVTPLIVPRVGRYRVVVTYRMADPTLADGFWNFEFDKYLVTIVGSSEEEDAGEVVITADAVIGMRGDPLTYDDLTPEQIAELQQPATDAIASIQEVELAVETAEGLRVQAELKRQSDTSTAIFNAEQATDDANDAALLANEKAGLAATATTQANDARDGANNAAQSAANLVNSYAADLAAKANQSDLVQLADEVDEKISRELVLELTLNASREIHLADIDYSTGIFTTNEPHGLTIGSTPVVNRIIVAINQDAENINVYDYLPDGIDPGAQLTAQGIDSNRFFIPGLTITDIGVTDLTKWHFEKGQFLNIINLNGYLYELEIIGRSHSQGYLYVDTDNSEFNISSDTDHVFLTQNSTSQSMVARSIGFGISNVYLNYKAKIDGRFGLNTVATYKTIRTRPLSDTNRRIYLETQIVDLQIIRSKNQGGKNTITRIGTGTGMGYQNGTKVYLYKLK